MRSSYHGIGQVISIFSSKVIILTKQPLKLPRNSTAPNYLIASDSAINFCFFILIRAFQNRPNELQSIPSSCDHAVSYACK